VAVVEVGEHLLQLLDVAALEVVVEEEQVTQVMDALPIVDLVQMEL
jgi:hypothetical protein